MVEASVRVDSRNRRPTNCGRECDKQKRAIKVQSMEVPRFAMARLAYSGSQPEARRTSPSACDGILRLTHLPRKRYGSGEAGRRGTRDRSLCDASPSASAHLEDNDAVAAGIGDRA